jgi:hypothetical protein
LQKLHPGSIRYMDPSQWCSDVADEIAATGNRRWCGASSWLPGWNQALGYNDVLQLAELLGSDVLISVGQLNQPSDWSTLIQWLSTSGWISKYAASGHKIYLEDGNETWNSGMGATLYYGNGMAYGYTLGPNMAAAKSAAGYDPNIIKLVGNSWGAANQGYGGFGWVHNVLTLAKGTPNGLPDFVDVAPYTLNYLGNFDTHGSNVAGTGAPFLDEWAEDANLDSVTAPISNSHGCRACSAYATGRAGERPDPRIHLGRALHRIYLQGQWLCGRSGDAAMGRQPPHGHRTRPKSRQREYRQASGDRSGDHQQCHRFEHQPGSSNPVRHTHLPISRRPECERFAHHTCQPCSALCELLRLQRWAGKLDHDLLQQQSKDA